MPKHRSDESQGGLHTSAAWLVAALAVSWLATASARAGRPGLGILAAAVYAAAHVARSTGPGAELSLLTLSGAIGAVSTSAVAYGGWISWPNPGLRIGLAPAWIVALWLVLGAYLHGHMKWLRGRLVLASVLGAGFGLGVHVAGVAMEAVALQPPAWFALAAIWASATPLLVAASQVVDEADPSFGPAKIMRRLLTIPAEAGGLFVITLLSPLLVPGFALIDVLRQARGRKPGALRFLVWLWSYMVAGLAGLAGLFFVWLFGGSDRSLGSRFIRWSHLVEQAWQIGLFDFMTRLYGLTLTIEEVPGDPALGTCDVWREKPALVFMRHASLMDTLMPSVLFTRPHGIDLRYVFKWELLADPAIDVAGNRLPNVFVARRGQRTGRDLEALRRLASGIGPKDWVLIYPEGTRYTPERHERILAKIRDENPDLAERAAAFSHVLPPRPGGPNALLEAAPDADVVFVAHAGLDRVPGLSDAWAGRLYGCRIQTRIWRIPRERIPQDPAERTAWLYEEWRKVNEWVKERAAE